MSFSPSNSRNLTVSDLNVSTTTLHGPVIKMRRQDNTTSSLTTSRHNLHRSTHIPLYNPRAHVPQPHPDDPQGNSVLADLAYIPTPISAATVSGMAAKSSLFASATGSSVRFDTAAERSRTDEELQELVTTLQEEIRELKQAHIECDKEIETLTDQMQQIRDIMVRSNENMARSVDNACFVVLPCRHYVVVHKGVKTLTNAPCPKCMKPVTESYLVKHK